MERQAQGREDPGKERGEIQFETAKVYCRPQKSAVFIIYFLNPFLWIKWAGLSNCGRKLGDWSSLEC